MCVCVCVCVCVHCVPYICIELIGGFPVSQLAQAMLQDALEYHDSKTGDSATANANLVVYRNDEIKRLFQVIANTILEL